MDPTVAAFLATLREPRFATPAQDLAAPFALKGVLDGADVVFFASPTDLMDYGREVHARVAAGEFGPIADYVEPPPAPPLIRKGA